MTNTVWSFTIWRFSIWKRNKSMHHIHRDWTSLQYMYLMAQAQGSFLASLPSAFGCRTLSGTFLVCACQSGVVMGRQFQPYESHIPFLLQFKVSQQCQSCPNRMCRFRMLACRPEPLSAVWSAHKSRRAIEGSEEIMP